MWIAAWSRPRGGASSGKSPVDRGKLGTKPSLLTDGHGLPLGCVVAGADCHEAPLLRPTLEKLARFETRFGVGLPDHITVHLDAGYDSAKTRDLLAEFGCHGLISQKRVPLQAGARRVVERANCSATALKFLAIAGKHVLNRTVVDQFTLVDPDSPIAHVFDGAG